MTQVFATVVVLCVCVACGVVVAALLDKKLGMGRGKRVAIGSLVSIGLIFLSATLYFADYYHADEMALQSLVSNEVVDVKETSNGLLFDGPGDNQKAFVFYPGGKVEYTAYAPLLRKISERGMDCFLVRMPLNFAFFGRGAVSQLMDGFDYERWYLAGHSLGGVVACMDASVMEDKGAGIVLLASYPTDAVDERLRLLSIYGTEDGCLNRSKYEEGRKCWPSHAAEVVIEGGNHAQFGCYGVQTGDGEATVGAQEQQDQTVDAIISFVWAEE